ncbi:baseplate J/gp47 family protein [Gluconobacter frateurii]|uniref:Baseplate protein J-like domain-containing protein n=1 Tax=Gluconobacter frateurii NRIC 0228 TaxID=1307946 RepID=A0ABQ0Q912_9PROT|nr:baseplate J/gp47 family protein [Gluconobacter frateurii]GBR09525.1 hypothetical protein AA0228_0706 [Gluconobacter frateurii NRIC 0228]GLP91931.1 Mu-like prophage FluMu protein gp47 [Gluconobacter frateurii]
MSAQIPTPQTLAQRFITALAGQQFQAQDGTIVTLDATAPATFEQVLAVLHGLSDYEIYLFIRDCLLEVIVTTATENGKLPDHALMWRTPRNPATAAVGMVVFTASASVTIPAGTLLTSDGSVQWATNEALTIAAGATATVDATCTTTGTAGNLLGGTGLTLLSPIAGVSSVAVDANGFAGGAAIEGVESWRARIIASVRTPPGSGTVADYTKWATGGGAVLVDVVKGWVGIGTVGVIFELVLGVAPTAAQVAQMQSVIAASAPVRANFTAVATVVVPQDLTIKLASDTAANRAAVTNALSPYYLGLGVAPLISVEALQAKIYAAAPGSNVLVSPAADIQLVAPQRAVLGTITWAAAS